MVDLLRLYIFNIFSDGDDTYRFVDPWEEEDHTIEATIISSDKGLPKHLGETLKRIKYKYKEKYYFYEPVITSRINNNGLKIKITMKEKVYDK